MTTLSNGAFEGIGEEKPVDSFNVSQGQEALDMASEDSFTSIGSPPTPADNQSLNSDTTLEFSRDSSLPSPDSAIGGTPGLTPESESPSNQFHTPIGKLQNVTKEAGEKKDEILSKVSPPTKEDLKPIQKEPPLVMGKVTGNEKKIDDNEYDDDVDDDDDDEEEEDEEEEDSEEELEDNADSEDESDASSSSSLVVMEKEDVEEINSTLVEAPASLLVDAEVNLKKGGDQESSGVSAIGALEAEPLGSSQEPLQVPLVPETLESSKQVPLTPLKDVEVVVPVSKEVVSEIISSPVKEEVKLQSQEQNVELNIGGGSPEVPKKEEVAKVEVVSEAFGKSDKLGIEETAPTAPIPAQVEASEGGLTDADLDFCLPEGEIPVCDLKLKDIGHPPTHSTPLTTKFVVPKIVVPDIELDATDVKNTPKKMESRDDTTEDEEDRKKVAPVAPMVMPEVKNDKIEDGGYEEDEEDGEEDEDDTVLSDSEMVVEATMAFPLAKKPNQEAPEEQVAAAVEKPVLTAEPVSEEVAVQMNIQVTQAPVKDTTPSGCESDIEDNDEEDSTVETPLLPSVAAPVEGAADRIPSSLELPETVIRLDTPQGSSVFLVGTAHFSRESQDDVANTIRAVKPDIVVVELCKARTAILQLDEETILEESRSLDFKKIQMILQQHGKIQGVLYLLLLSVSAHITKQLGMAPGGEFRTAFAEARRSAPGCLIQFGDRPIQVTLSRALASLSLWHKIKLTWHILTSKEPISKEEVEKCKQRDFIEEMLAEMTGQFPAISEVFVKERDIYLCRSLQAAAQPVPNPMSPSGIAPRVVVGVVGIGHVPGIVERWGKVTDDDIPPIMKIPPPSRTTQILKVTFKLTCYGLLSYGAYKCLPSTTKSSIQSVIKNVADSLPQKWLK